MAAVSKEYTNFYENIKEAMMRLQHTVVMYDGFPYYVLTIDSHKPDGIFRVYMEPLGGKRGSVIGRGLSVPYDGPNGYRGPEMDKWLDANKDSGVIRKQMNSPLFNKFRPFDLGMCNIDGNVVYTERQPQRQTYQGLTQQMVYQLPVSLGPRLSVTKNALVGIQHPAFKACVLAEHPSYDECIKNLLDPEISNEGVAFSRHFALVRGPVDTLFLAYKSDIVGAVTDGSKTLRLSKSHRHTREVIEELGVFSEIKIA